MKKKLLALVLCVTMVLTMMTGCGNSNTKNTGGDKTKTEDNDKKDDTKKDDTAATDAAQASPTPVPNTVEGDVNAKDAFVVYGWNDDIKNTVLRVFKEKYPEDAKRIVFVNTGGTDNYQQKVDALWKDPDNKFYPDVFGMEMDYILKYTSAPQTLSMDEVGVPKDVYKNMYQYTLDGATANGKLKGLSWQACPGAIVYRRSLAKKYLGVSDPKDVQKYFADWATVEKTAQTVKDKSAGKCKLFCGYADLQRPYQALRKEAWVDNKTLKIDPKMEEYMEVAKKYVEKGYVGSGSADMQFKENWCASMDKDDVFAYTGCTWFLQYSLQDNAKKTVGDWAICAPPQNYYWGGTWLGVSEHCSDKKLAAKFLSVLGDKECMKKIYTNQGDFPNNKEAIADLVKENPDSKVKTILGGQNSIEFFQPMAEKITLPKMCGEDLYMNNLFNDQVGQYATGAKDKDACIADFKSKAADQFPYVKVD